MSETTAYSRRGQTNSRAENSKTNMNGEAADMEFLQEWADKLDDEQREMDELKATVASLELDAIGLRHYIFILKGKLRREQAKLRTVMMRDNSTPLRRTESVNLVDEIARTSK